MLIPIAPDLYFLRLYCRGNGSYIFSEAQIIFQLVKSGQKRDRKFSYCFGGGGANEYRLVDMSYLVVHCHICVTGALCIP